MKLFLPGPACCALMVFLFACLAPERQATPASGVPQKTHGSTGSPQAPDASDLIPAMLARQPGIGTAVLNNAGLYEVQILYTQINRDGNNFPSFTQYSYRLNSRSYFNPASLVKLPVLCLALQKIGELRVPGLDRNTRLAIGKEHSCQTIPLPDPSGPPTIARFVEKVLLVSDNDAYNRLYEFLGQQYIHEQLSTRGYPDVRIIRRFCSCDHDENRYTNPFSFYNDRGARLYFQPQAVNPQALVNPLPGLKRGRGYVDSRGAYIGRPFDYSHSNNLSLCDANAMLMRVMFPEAFPPPQRFNLSPDDYRFVYRYLCMLPGESGRQPYARQDRYPDNFKKYFIFGDATGARADMRGGPVRSFNLVGKTDGYLSEVAYIVDVQRGIEFFLSAVIYVNSDQVLRDGRYEYESIGIPFLAQLGRAVYSYELARKKEFAPDLTRLASLWHAAD